MTRPLVFVLLTLGCWTACQNKHGATPNTESDAEEAPLFTLLPSSETGITFRNDLQYDHDFNIYRYRNFYNGGGVAVGDINNDGLPDVFFTANMGQNKLYLNKGNLKFEDISQKAGIEGSGSWATGAAMADVNGDGWLDIYVCNSGNPRSDETGNRHFKRENELFINNGAAGQAWAGAFTESAGQYGLADRGLSTHAAFFDYDRDGDLDMYMLNNSFQPIGSFDLRRNLRYTRDSLGGHKLYKNNMPGLSKTTQPTSSAPRFQDVSTQAGILGSVIAFGLGVTVGDLDMDGWQDVYVSNDFFERDYLYHNKGDGSFAEQLEQSMRHISAASMGADMADINNDGYPDVFVTDMLPEHDYRIKTTTSFDSPDRFLYTTTQGYYNQFTRNMLHLNNTDGTFSEIACLAGAEATDWSWGALLFDMDNDGWKDIFVANGIAQDLTNQDYLMFASDPFVKQEIIAGGQVNFKRLIDSIPSEKQANYAFRNLHNQHFAQRTKDWGLSTPSFSNGSAYADLDNDGDLDLVVSNVNMEAFVYRNEAEKVLPNNHYLKLELQGADWNTAALGAKIFLRAGGQTFFQEQMPMRGFQSSMDPRPNFGLGEIATVDTVLVVWPTGNKITLLTGVKTNQTLKLRQTDATQASFALPWLAPVASKIRFSPLAGNAGVQWKHEESNFYDWDRDRLLYFRYSTEGPRTAVGDANGDGREDFFVCGAAGQAGALWLQKPDGKFQRSRQPALDLDALCEDADATFFDADGDQDLDLYVASGSNEFQPLSPELGDRLYLNDGKGNLLRKTGAVPDEKPFASACVKPADWDGDGDQDLFVGMRLLPGKVGVPVGGYLLQNDGTGSFSMTQPEELKNLGLLTDALWVDIDADRDLDLLVVGEWMAPCLFRNDTGSGGIGRKFTNISTDAGLADLTGLWKRIGAGDFNGDGRPDFLLGNFGLNSRLKATPKEPLSLFFNDFDKNGTPEQIFCRYTDGKLLPYTLRNELVGNLPTLKKRFLHYRDYANKTMPEIFNQDQMKNTIRLQAGTLASGLLLSQPGGKYRFEPLPSEGQFAPLFGMAVADIDGDGHLDAITGGNFNGAKPEFGFIDADYGLVLKGDGQGHFQVLRTPATGLRLDGEIRDLRMLNIKGQSSLLVARNNNTIEFYSINNASLNN